MLEKHYLRKLEAVTTQANQHLNQLEPIRADKAETWQDFCQSMHAILDLALDPRASSEERGYAWSHLQQWRAWGIRRM